MLNYFSRSKVLDCDCYVADYTKSTDGKTGVVIALDPFADIPFFHLKKVNQSQHLPYFAVNLEEYPSFIKGDNNCECFFSSLREEGISWILFLELKYCEERNIDEHAIKAHKQMEAIKNRLVEMGLVDLSSKRVYFTFSAPGHDELSPFAGFAVTQSDTLKEIQESGVRFLPYNTVLIATPEYLFAPVRR